MSIISEIKKSQAKAFRRIYFRRRSLTDYEADWQEVPSKYIRSFGAIEYGIEGIKVNFFKFSGYSFRVDNVDGFFNDVDDGSSFFYQYPALPRTMVKVEAGYEATDGTEYPTNPSLFVGLLGSDFTYSPNNIMTLKADHFTKIFEEFNANAIPSMTGNYTASEVITKVRDYQDSNTVAVFQKYISLGAWTIESTTTQYVMSTNTTLQNISCWDLFTKFSEAENKILGIDRTGAFFFKTKTPDTIPVFHFSGVGDTNRTYGTNLLRNISKRKAYEKIYNRIVVKLAKENTTTSHYEKSEVWAWADSSSSFLYGVRTYNVDNDFLTTGTASTIADNIYDEYLEPKVEVALDSKFVPQIDLNDLVTLTHKTATPTSGDLWGYFLWGSGKFSQFKGNYTFDQDEFRVLSLRHDINNFKTSVLLRGL